MSTEFTPQDTTDTSKDIKVTFSLSAADYAGAKKIAEQEGVSVTHILRRAVKTEQFLKNEENAGKKILIDDNKSIQRLIRMG